MHALHPAASAAAPRCPVCAFAGLELDEVALGRSRLLLYECPRCEHRSTTRVELALPPSAAAPARGRRLVRTLPDAA
jgi:hypothetical protein